MSSDDRTLDAIRSARENIGLIQTWAGAPPLAALQEDLRTRYAVERAFIALDATLKDIPPALATEYGLPVRAVAGFRNVLAHTYDDILDERVVLTIREDPPLLDAALAALAATLGGGGA